MFVVRVLIIQDGDDLLSKSLARRLEQLPDFHVVGVYGSSPDDEILDLARGQIDAAVLIGDSADLDFQADTLIAFDPNITVLRITKKTARLRIMPAVAEFGIDHLVETLRTATRQTQTAHRKRLIHRSIVIGARTGAWTQETYDAFQAVRDWLIAFLVAAVEREPEHRSDDLRGFSAGRNTLLKLLKRERGEVSGESVSERWSDLEKVFASASEAVPLVSLVRRLELTAIEQKVLFLCLAPELDAAFQRAFGFLHDDHAARRPSLGLISSLLGDGLDVRSNLVASSLREWRIVVNATASEWTSADQLGLDGSITAWLFDGVELATADPQLARLVFNLAQPAGILGPRDDDRDRLLIAVDKAPAKALIALTGDRSGWLVRSQSAAVDTGCDGVRVDAAALAEVPTAEVENIAKRVARAVLLHDAMVIVDNGIGAAAAGVQLESLLLAVSNVARLPVIVVGEIPSPTFALADRIFATLERSPADARERKQAVLEAAGSARVTIESDDAWRVALRSKLSERDMSAAVWLARQDADAGAAIGPAELARACRRIASPRLPNFARRIEPDVTFADVVLPEDRHRQLREIVAHVDLAPKVLDDWQFGAQLAYGRAIAALFSGPSGTGKTMAALAVAKEISTELYHVDLSRIVSKYIGETEKNLDAMFDEAERACAVLLFDEADALFGKRSEVSDAHDRYANLEVAYLLQRIEAYDGLAILTTNFRQNIDQAFLRRFRFVVDFPMPDAVAREAIWRQCLPSTAPQDPDIDLRFIARRLELAGGNIRQVTLRAAFAAAAEQKPIAMKHIVEATRAELIKIGMHQAERELTERVA